MTHSRIKIIRFRPLELKYLQLARLLKPFEDAGVVEDFSNNPTKELELILKIYNDESAKSHYHFDHILDNGDSQETPETLFDHLHYRDETWPSLIYYFDRGEGQAPTDFHGITNHYQLQTILRMAQNRHEVSEDIKINHEKD